MNVNTNSLGFSEHWSEDDLSDLSTFSLKHGVRSEVTREVIGDEGDLQKRRGVPAMNCKRLEWLEYSDSGWDGQTGGEDLPTWTKIEECVRAMDKFRRPGVFLSRDEGEIGDALPDIELVGGAGDFFLVIMVDGRRLNWFNPVGADQMVDVWTSDQGTSIPEKYLIHDVELVLRIVKHYCQTGALLPGQQWREVK